MQNSVNIIICLSSAILAHGCATVNYQTLDNEVAPSVANDQCGKNRVIAIMKGRGIYHPVQDPSWHPVSEEQHRSVQSAFDNIVDAYRIGDICMMEKMMDEIPSIAMHMVDTDFVVHQRPFSTLVSKSFLRQSDLRDFDDIKDCQKYFSLNMTAVRFLGNLALRRQEYSVALKSYDVKTYQQINRYKEKFRREGRRDLVTCADDALAVWVAQINCNNGFTRQYMLRQLMLQLMPSCKAEYTADQLFQAVRHHADDLIAAGCTPDWLSDFDGDTVQ